MDRAGKLVWIVIGGGVLCSVGLLAFIGLMVMGRTSGTAMPSAPVLSYSQQASAYLTRLQNVEGEALDAIGRRQKRTLGPEAFEQELDRLSQSEQAEYRATADMRPVASRYFEADVKLSTVHSLAEDALKSVKAAWSSGASGERSYSLDQLGTVDKQRQICVDEFRALESAR